MVGYPDTNPAPAPRMIAQRVLYVEQNLIFRHMDISLRGRNELLNTEIEVHKIKLLLLIEYPVFLICIKLLISYFRNYRF